MMNSKENETLVASSFGKLPDHLLIEIFIRIPVPEWAQVSCVKKQWATLFREECLWQAALDRTYPSASRAKRWPGPIPRGLSRRRYEALYVSRHIFAIDGELDEIVGHAYLFLKEQLQRSTVPPPSGILHGTLIDQFIACGKTRDVAHELASQIWLAVLDNLEENEEYGPVVSIRIAHRPALFVADRTLAHQALVQNGAVFADRPPAAPTNRILSSNQHTISSAAYGPTWRLLRRNLTANILHPSRISSFSNARRWVLQLLLDRLLVTSSDITSTSSTNGVCVKEHFQYAMFCLLVLMCFGDKLDEPKIKDIETVQRRLLLRLRRFNILNFWPKITKILLRKRWQELLQLCQDQQDVLAPLIEARRNKAESESKAIVCYVDTLLDLRLPADVKEREKEMSRKLEMSEMVSLCSEFLNAGTDTTSTALEWIMANIVKHPRIQDKLYAEIKQVLTSKQQHEEEEVGRVVVEEEDLQKMAYLKAVVLEGLRRHPPGHFLLPHAVTEEEVVLGGHAVPEEASINFMVADIGWDPSVWEDPMAFKPERFLGNGGEVVEMITGSKEIKMMPFGAGRRICPGHGLAILHLEYFVANLVWRFEWNYKASASASAAEVDLSEKQEFTTVMKYPLKARLSPRSP